MKHWHRILAVSGILAAGVWRAAAQGGASQFAIEGTITDPDGQPVTNAVIVVGPLPWPSGNGVSDSKGHYSVGWSGPDEQYGVVVRVPEKDWSVLKQLDRGTSHLDLKLENSWRLKAQVQDPDGKPIEGASAVISYNPKSGSEARAFALNYSPPARTDKDGKFEFGAMPIGQPYFIRVSAPGYTGASQSPRPDPGNPTASQSLTFTLRKPGGDTTTSTTTSTTTTVVRQMAASSTDQAASATLEGTVRGPDGAPVPAAAVSVRGGGAGMVDSVYTDAQGHYSLKWTPPDAGQNFQPSLYVSSEAKGWVSLDQIDPGATHLDVKLQPELTVTANVKETDGRPIVGAAVLYFVTSGNIGFQLNPAMAIPPSDSQGHVEVHGLPQGHQLRLRISADNHGMLAKVATETDTAKARYDFPDFVLPVANMKLSGKVLNPDGKPAVNFPVRATGTGQPVGLATFTDDKGAFEFTNVCEGQIMVIANSGFRGRGGPGARGGGGPTARGQAQAQARGGDTNVVLRLSDPVNNVVAVGQPNMPNSITLTGRVTDASGAPVAGAKVYVCPNVVMANPNGDGVTDADGHYSVQIQQPQYTFQSLQNNNNNQNIPPPQIVARSEEKNLAVAHALYPTNISVDLVLGPGMEMSGKVVDSKGNPLTAATYQIMIRGGYGYGQLQNRTPQVDSHGAFSLNALPQGSDYYVSITCPGYGQGTTNMTSSQTQSKTIDLGAIALRTADQRLEGKVVDVNNKPVSGAHVQIYGQGQPSEMHDADGDGHFAFKVCEGMVQIYAYPASGGVNIQQMTARSGDLNVLVKIGAPQQPQYVNNGRVIRGSPRFNDLKPRDWSWAAISLWPAAHPKVLAVALTIQIMAALGTAGGIFWAVRKR